MAKFNHHPASSPSVQKFHVALDGQESKALGLRRPARFSVELDLSNLMPMFKAAGRSLGQESTCALGALVVRRTQELPTQRFVVSMVVNCLCGCRAIHEGTFSVDDASEDAARARVEQFLNRLGDRAGDYFWPDALQPVLKSWTLTPERAIDPFPFDG